MSLWIAGLGTALPEHTMDQTQAAVLAQQICCSSEEQARLLAVLYRKAGVRNRFTAVPHERALDWLPTEAQVATASEAGAASANGHAAVGAEALPQADAGPSLGPTTSERMQFYDECAPSLARAAAEKALTESGIDPVSITHLVTVSCTGFVAPGVDVALIDQLGLRPTTERVNVGFMGCHGALNGLRVARALTSADPQARVLLVAVELCSLHYRYQWDPERFIGNALFADGAAALVCLGDDAAAQTWSGDPAKLLANGHNGAAILASPAQSNWQVIATGSCLLPDSTDAMTWRVGDHGFEMTLSSRVPDLISQHLRPWLSQWLSASGLAIDDVQSWAVHPGGPRIVSAVEESLSLPREATSVSREVLAECGNMSSPTVLFIFDRLRRAGARGPLVMLGFGPGLMAEAALLQ